MDKLIIHGGVPLYGEVDISGSKNAALPILAATILAAEPVKVTNVPDLHDVTTMMALLSHLGLRFMLDGSSMAIEVDANTVNCFEAPYDLVKAMRASILVLGPLLARYGRATVALPGGCAIGTRPIDFHVKGLQALGADLQIVDGYIQAHCDGRLHGNVIEFDTVSVTGTENILMAAVLAEGQTTIKNAAREPEVGDLVKFLTTLGAKIRGAGTSTIIVEGVERLGGGEHRILPDRIEAGTYLTAAALTQGKIKVNNIAPENLLSLLIKLAEAGAKLSIGGDWIQLDMCNKRPNAVDICTAPYPAIATDMQAQLMAMNILAQGKSKITETVFENRFMHVQEMVRMGANINLHNNTAVCTGVKKLAGALVKATDLRASAGLVLAGLAAEGKTDITHIYHIDRGYERIEEKLLQLGAHIKRVLE